VVVSQRDARARTARYGLDNGDPEDASALVERARAVESSLVLAVAYDRPDAVPDTIFGLDDAALRRVVALTLARVNIAHPTEVSVLISDDEGLRVLNRDYRDRDESTDVLSFPLLDEPLVDAPPDQLWQSEAEEHGDITPTGADLALGELPGEEVDELGMNGNEGEPDDLDVDAPSGTLPLGDIAISRDAVARQASQAGHGPAWELAYLLAHGVLHLVGYDDQTDAGYQAMVAHQEAILEAANISR
jgi:probable rRNA maturation factor